MPSTRTDFYAKTRPVYSKSGGLRIETTVTAIERDILTGRIVKRASGQFMNQRQVSRFLEQINKGELSGARAMGILKGRSKKSNLELVKSGARSLVQLVEDYIPMTDLNRDRLAYMFNQMDWDDFEAFYNQNTDIVEKTYRVGSPRATDKDRNIIYPTNFERNNTVDTLIDKLQTYLNITDAELNENVPVTHYNEGIRKKSYATPRFSKKFYS